jgi:hypothetical protein
VNGNIYDDERTRWLVQNSLAAFSFLGALIEAVLIRLQVSIDLSWIFLGLSTIEGVDLLPNGTIYCQVDVTCRRYVGEHAAHPARATSRSSSTVDSKC